ncbi:HSP20-like chaperone [Tuber brumale]|nr:HSP20-like chaperone [Tuber brumale]
MPAPVFQYLFFPELNHCPCPPRKSFSPRFDVRETANVYIVEGELPGIIDRSNISIEFTDRGDLIVRGRVDRSSTTVVPQAQPQTPSSSSPSQETSGKEDKGEYPTIEDVPDEDDWMGITDSPTEKARVEGEAAKAEKPVEKKEQPRGKKEKGEEWPKRLLSERSVGGFARSFSFPAVIDHDAVTASLQHGILRVVVPKKVFDAGKRIEIQ